MSKKKVICKYKFQETYNPLYVNGAQGGVTPKGEIAVNFYLERHALPKSQMYSVENESVMVEIEDEVAPQDLRESFIRYVQTGVIMDYSTAKAVHTWLGNHLKNLETIKEEKKSDE